MPDTTPQGRDRVTRIALIGAPNCGKTSLFNALTGANQRVGNYSGVTVERKEGTAVTPGGYGLSIIDLPGTHTLSANSLEEQIAVDVILGRQPGSRAPDGILAVIDATNLDQGLYLVQQLIELGLPVAVACTGCLLVPISVLRGK